VESSGRGAFVVGALLVAIALTGSAGIAVVGGAAALSAQDDGCSADASGSVPTSAKAGGIPSSLVPLYRGAATRYGLGPDGWAWLASINAQETDFGRNLSTSSAGAVGWMQFLPSTWASYGLDANGDGSASPYDPADAIFAAARYLQALGAPRDWHHAVVDYGGGAEWYYVAVAARARGYAGHALAVGGGADPVPGCSAALVGDGEYVSPLPPGLPFVNARTDMGVDLETGSVGVGRQLVAIGDAQVLAIKPMGAFGPTWISYRLLSGSLRGRAIFIGHSGPPLVAVGQRVAAGTALIAIHGGSYGGPAGHFEIGWALADGSAPAEANHYSEGQVTSEGRSFRRFLARLGMPVCGSTERAAGWC
jgi:Transglycosylase SLT domain